MFFIKTPYWLKKLYSEYLWHIPVQEKILYLSFDDGPNARTTPFILEQLKKYNAKATFFCIGKNVAAEPELYNAILNEGHTVGNHTQNHLKGWNTNVETYIENVKQAQQYIDSKLFRPPYGRIKKKQAIKLTHEKEFKIIMWDVLSGDFDKTIQPEDCLLNVINKAKKGSIIVFHDSEKAFINMSFALSGTLQYFAERGFRFEAINV